MSRAIRVFSAPQLFARDLLVRYGVICATIKSFFILSLLLGCAQQKATLIEPAGRSECLKRVVDRQYIVKYRDHLAVEYIADVEVFRARPDVEWLEPNYRVGRRRVRPIVINDPPALYTDTARLVGADVAWRMGIRGQGVRVAVVDSGIDYKLKRLERAFLDPRAEISIQPTPNIVDEDLDGYVDDIYGWNFVSETPNVIDETGHGTHIAGIIAAAHDSRNSDEAQFGIAPEALLVAADFMDEEPGDEFRAIRAIEYSIKRGAKIVNNSWSNFCSTTLRASFEGWQEQNVIFVNAAGNEGENIDPVEIFPSNLNLKNTITVGSVNERGHRSLFSNYGRNVLVYAPGEDILSLAPNRDWLVSRSGTSMSTAYVSGALALAWSAYPDRTAADLVATMRHVAQQSGDPWMIHVPTLLHALKR